MLTGTSSLRYKNRWLGLRSRIGVTFHWQFRDWTPHFSSFLSLLIYFCPFAPHHKYTNNGHTNTHSERQDLSVTIQPLLQAPQISNSNSEIIIISKHFSSLHPLPCCCPTTPTHKSLSRAFTNTLSHHIHPSVTQQPSLPAPQLSLSISATISRSKHLSVYSYPPPTHKHSEPLLEYPVPCRAKSPNGTEVAMSR